MRKTPAVLIVVAGILLSGVSAAQFDPGESPIPGLTSTPFSIRAVLDRNAALPGGEVRIGFILDAAEKHKIYRSSVKVTFGDAAVEVLDIDVPPGVKAEDADLVPGETILKGESVVVATVKLKADAAGTVRLKASVAFLGCSDKLCFPPDVRTVAVDIPVTTSREEVVPVNQAYFVAKDAPSKDELAKIVEEQTARHDFAKTVEASGYTVALLIAFAAGVLVSFTPCVWPLIPITVAVVGARAPGAGWKRGLALSSLYVLGMAVTYAALGALAGLIGKSVLTLAQSPWLVGVVCLIFVALALSMFGVWELRLPARVTGRLQKKHGSGALAVVVTGVLSGLVASPCVSAPLLGLFAGVAALGSVPIGMLAGFVFALGMGVILIVAGTSAKALASLPRSGEWMVAVQRLFGWVLLAAAVYFAHMIIGTAAYRILMGVLLICAGVFWGALKIAAAGTGKQKVLRAAAIVVLVGGVFTVAAGVVPLGRSKPSVPEDGIRWISSVEEGLARATAEGRPAMIDFTADWCTYCHEMDRDVLSRQAVVDESRRFVMIKRDVTRHDEAVDALYRKYGIVGPPAFVFVRSNGEHSTVNQKLDLDTFLKLMRAAR